MSITAVKSNAEFELFCTLEDTLKTTRGKPICKPLLRTSSVAKYFSSSSEQYLQLSCSSSLYSNSHPALSVHLRCAFGYEGGGFYHHRSHKFQTLCKKSGGMRRTKETPTQNCHSLSLLQPMQITNVKPNYQYHCGLKVVCTWSCCILDMDWTALIQLKR